MRGNNAEKIVITFLKEQLGDGVKVGLRVPSTGNTFVRIERNGGDYPTRVSERVILIVEGYAPTEEEAFELMAEIQEVMALMSVAPTLSSFVYRARPEGNLVPLPDPNHTSFRYTQNYSVHMRGKKSERVLK